MAPSQVRPNAVSVRSMRPAQPGTTRARSRSSMRTSQRPPALRASRKLPSAATSEPRCSAPLGEGAKRPMYCCGERCAASVILWGGLAIAVVAVAVLALAALAALLCLDAQRRHRARLEAFNADLLAGLQTIAVGAVLDALE